MLKHLVILMIKVKFFNMHMNRSSNPNDAHSLADDRGWMESLNQLYTRDHDYTWKDIQLTCTDDYDYAVVIDSVFTQNYFDPAKTILFRMEPKALRDKFTNYQQQVKPETFLKVYDFNILWSWVGFFDYNQFFTESFEKSKILSSIISANHATFGHIDRLRFLSYLDRLACFDHYGDERGISGFFAEIKSYRGRIQTKKEGLIPYKYHFNAENSYEYNYFSEKFIDALLCECLVFYDGCLNLEDYIDKDAYIRLDLKNPEQSLEIVRTAIEHNEWERRIDLIRQEKRKVLEELNILNVVHNTVHGHKNYFEK